MRYRHVLALVLCCLTLGCVSAADERIQAAAEGNLRDLQLLETGLLELVPADLAPVDFSQVGGRGAQPVLYRPRDGWRIVLRGAQLRAASLVAWSKGEPFDHAAGVEALIVPALEQARRNLPDPDDQ